jgi:hypothetical protein
MTDTNRWLALIISLPSNNSTARMRIWRALKSMGCAALRDGVYMLPASPGAERLLRGQMDEISSAGGHARLLQCQAMDAKEAAAFAAMFDRSTDYAALLEELQNFIRSSPHADTTTAQRKLQRWQQQFDQLSEIDFFPGLAREQVGAALLQARTAQLSDEPRAGAGKISKLKPAQYRNRLWATRRHLWADRMASAWLIRRFIDPEARFLWLRRPEDCPQEALGFDFNGARFTHQGNRVTFEVLLASFGLEKDTALTRIASAIHYLDVGGVPVAEAAGLEALLRGARELCTDDDSLLAAASGIFDLLYSAHQH